MARRHGSEGIISVAWNPGSLRSDIQRHVGSVARAFLKVINHDPIFGVYTELYAACSVDINEENNCAYIIPWGLGQ